MGLMDILNGMQNGPRGAPQPKSGTGSGGGGMSPMTMALIGLLAYKALKSFGGSQTAAPGTRAPTPGGGNVSADATGGGGLGDILGGLLGGNARGTPGAGPSAGGLGDILGGLLGGSGGKGGAIPGELGGLLGGAAGGSVLSGGLDQLLKDMQNRGQAKAAQSWVGSGNNEGIQPDDLATALGSGAIDAMVKQSGMPRDELLENLSQQLPHIVDQLTPQGRLPTREEAERML